MKRKTKTPKERVLARHPMATAMRFSELERTGEFRRFRWLITHLDFSGYMNSHTASVAWADAARRLGETK